MESLRPGDPPEIGGYRLLARLGEGGMGEVFLARTASGRPLALKTVHRHLSLEADFAERFAREIRANDRVRCPWTVSVVDFSPSQESPQWLATEYIPAPSLGDWVHRHGPLAEPAVRCLARELSAALVTVRAAGVVHRDIKPANVLLGPERPFLIDFGIARAVRDPRHTQTGTVIGTPGYLAPEQATGTVAGAPADVFSLAAVLVYAATGRSPFLAHGEELSLPALLYRIVHDEPLLDGVPPALRALVGECLAKDPDRRPTAEALRERLGAGAESDWSESLPPALVADAARRRSDLHGLLTTPRPSPPAPAAAPTPLPPLRPEDTPPPPGMPHADTPTPEAPALGSPSPGTAAPGVPAWGTPAPGAPAPGVPAWGTPTPSASGTSGARGAAGASGWGMPTPGASAPAAPASSMPAFAAPVPPPVPHQPPATSPVGPWAAPVAAPAGSRSRWASRRQRAIGAAAGAVVVAALITLAIHLSGAWGGGGSGAGDGRGSGDGAKPGTSTAATASSLPAAWVGTWSGTGPGTPDADGITRARTGEFDVTVTLHGGAVGELVGRQVSDVKETASGRNLGCTEALELRQIRENTLVFAAVTSHPTDRSGSFDCPRGNLYVLTLAAPDRVTLEAEGAQSAGAPTELTRHP
ncbi:protein kinase [Streptomyces sp. NPDC058662]|uniref:serine/threonine-protein kinase n=1 Tax=Streptomyces sp. NPDC058662 TaxID=3346583 RepID=UPI00364B02C3